MADHSTLLADCRTRFADALVTAVTEVGIRSPALIDTLSRHAGLAFDELAGLHDQEEFKRLRSMTASRISLVHPEDMDLTVALINLSHTLTDACERELPRLHLLFMRLLGQDSSILDQLPVGPDAACIALRAMCDEGELTGTLRLELPNRVEEALIKALRALYSALTDTLQAAGVEPQSLLRSASDGPRGGYASPGQAPSGSSGMGYGEAGQESLSEARIPDSPLGRLQGALLRRRGGSTGGGSGGGGFGSAGGGAQIDPSLLAAILERVLIWLNERQQTAAGLPYGSSAPAPGFAELNSLLPADNNAALDAIGLSFDVLAADPQLCPAVKPSLERLRLPLSKLALLDAGVLIDPQHPARRLIDVLLRLAMSLAPATTAEHPVCQAIEEAAHRVQREFERDAGVFASVGAPLEALETTRSNDLVQRIEALLPLAEQEARREHSRNRAARAIRALCAGDVPVPVRAFLEQLWVRVLAAIHQHAGEKCEPWLRALATANELVDSVQPKADAAARQALLGSLPKLLSQLRAGLDAIGTPEQLRERAFQSFVDCHTAVIQGKPPAISGVDKLEVATAPRIETVADTPGLHVVRLAPDGEPERGVPEWINQLATGSWLQLTLPDATQRRLCVAWCGGTPRLLLAAEPGSDFVIIFPQRWLQARAAEHAAQALLPDGVFERAAEAAIERYH
ncbi:DUF1631 family protein [Uliginosibacterium sp. 31-16]|uniref:DUF1631 family protein n=1 Tax=Uliginosibacterium sp. 31-16 TaxID=3068315 RepID=UPI00273D0A07|nr:DUF1631 family protein [Uliginosibacterium sp. 31-16]MDP5238838.1 DUF1631 family protein [Uliginosibacterium sp. 31-16]